MKTPLNKILVKYTAGNEFIYRSNNSSYTGYYHTIDDVNFMTEQSFSSKSKEIIKITSKSTSKIASQIAKPTQTQYITRNITEHPIRYKYIDEKTYNRLQTLPEYQLIILPANFDVNLFGNKYPGLIEFLNGHI